MLSVVIPSWNGLELLRENLPAVLAATEFYRQQAGGDVEVIVVDDGGSDETPEAIPREFPQVRSLRREINGGFAAACNTGFAACRNPIVVLLNNDVRVETDYLIHLAPHFDDSDVFAVTARVFEWDEPVFATGGKVGRFRKGFWSAYFNYDASAAEAAEWIASGRLLSFYAVGGFAAYDRSKLQQLGGFLEILSPFHWEDIDLSYRGWKRGWQVRYEPRSRAFHRTSATIGKHFQPRKVEEVAVRNRILFHWINVHQTSWLLRHLGMLGLLTASRFLVGDLTFYRGLWGALRSLREALSLRRVERSQSRRGDRQIAKLLAEFYRTAPVRIYKNRSEVTRSHPGLG